MPHFRFFSRDVPDRTGCRRACLSASSVSGVSLQRFLDPASEFGEYGIRIFSRLFRRTFFNPVCDRRQNARKGKKDGLIDFPGIAESHLKLGRMNIHVHVPRRQFDEEHGLGVSSCLNKSPVSRHDGMVDKGVFHVTPVHIAEDSPGCGTGKIRPGRETLYSDNASLSLNREELVLDADAQNQGNPFSNIRRCGDMKQGFPVRRDPESDPWAGQKRPRDHLKAIGLFRGLLLQKLSSNRDGSENIGNGDSRPLGTAGFHVFHDFPALHPDPAA